jgi:hypothetical protein
MLLCPPFPAAAGAVYARRPSFKLHTCGLVLVGCFRYDDGRRITAISNTTLVADVYLHYPGGTGCNQLARQLGSASTQARSASTHSSTSQVCVTSAAMNVSRYYTNPQFADWQASSRAASLPNTLGNSIARLQLAATAAATAANLLLLLYCC